MTDQGILTPVQNDVVVLLARAAAASLRAANAALAPFGLRARHYAALRIAHETGGVPQARISALLGLDPSAVVAIVDELQRRGLVHRRRDASDRRTKLVLITDSGRSVLDEATQATSAVRDQALGGLPASEHPEFLRLLRLVLQ